MGMFRLLTRKRAIDDYHTYGTRGSGRWGILVIAGIVVALAWSPLLGIIIAVIGLVALRVNIVRITNRPVGVGN